MIILYRLNENSSDFLKNGKIKSFSDFYLVYKYVCLFENYAKPLICFDFGIILKYAFFKITYIMIQF